MDMPGILGQYFTRLATTTGDGLADLVTDDVTFDGPFFRAAGKREFLAGMQQWLRLPKTYHLHQQFVAGEETCSLYTVEVVSPAGESVSIDMADWITLRDGQIARERVYFDPRAWAQALGHR